jgi:hypothetical protein
MREIACEFNGLIWRKQNVKRALSHFESGTLRASADSQWKSPWRPWRPWSYFGLFTYEARTRTDTAADWPQADQDFGLVEAED